MWQISYPPANGANQGNYFLPKIHKLAVFLRKNWLTKTAQAAKRATFFHLFFCSGSMKDQIIFSLFGQSRDNWGQSLEQTDRRTNSLTPYTDLCGFFLSVKFATSLLALLHFCL